MNQTLPATSAPAVPPKRRRWWMFFVQFSLRTLLGVMTLAAALCWWFLQPHVRDEEIAGKYLKLRRQVRLVITAPDEIWSSSTTEVETVRGESYRRVNAGSWRLRDERDDLLVSGQYENGRQHGAWTIYHVNGRHAAEGIVDRGVRQGLWKTWDENGKPVSEVTYRAGAAFPSRRPRRSLESFGGCGSFLRVVGADMTRPFSAGGLGNDGLIGGGFPAAPASAKDLPGRAQLHGPARGWHSTGQLQFKGEYLSDRRNGAWTFFDAEGRVTAQGNYCQGKREGTWKVLDGPSRELCEVEYLDGRLQAEHQRQLAWLESELNSGNLKRQMAAALRLQQMGLAGAQLIVPALDDPSDAVKIVAIRALEEIELPSAIPDASTQSLVAEVLAKIEPLLESDNDWLASEATLVVFCGRAQLRQELFPKLIAAVRNSSDAAWQLRALGSIYHCDPPRRLPALNEMAFAAREAAEDDSAAHSLDRIDFTGFVAGLDELAEPLCEAGRSPQAVVRQFALEVIHRIALAGPLRKATSPGKAITPQHEIPQPYHDLVERAKSDADPAIRKLADSVGQTPNLGGGGFF